MVTLSKKELQSKLSVIQSMKGHKSLLCLTRLENDGLVISSIVECVGACAWLVAGDKNSNKVENCIVELEEFVRAATVGTGEEVDLDFTEEQEGTFVIITTNMVTAKQKVIPSDTALISDEKIDSLLEEIKNDEGEGIVSINRNVLDMMCNLGIKEKREMKSRDTDENARYLCTYINMKEAKATVCRYSVRNAVYVTKDSGCAETHTQSLVIKNELLDGVARQFAVAAEEGQVKMKISSEGEILTIITGDGMLMLPINERAGVSKEDVDNYDVITPAIESLRDTEEMNSIVNITVTTKGLLEHMQTISKFGLDGKFNVKIAKDGKLTMSGSSESMNAITTMDSTVEGIEEDLQILNQDPRNLSEILTTALTTVGKDEDKTVKLEFIKPTNDKSEEDKMIIATSDDFKGVAIWD